MKGLMLRIACVAALMVCTLGFSARAAEKQLAVVVWQGDEEVYSFYVSDNPVLNVVDGNAVIKSDGRWEYISSSDLLVWEGYTQECYFSIPMSESAGYRLTLEQRSYTGDFYLQSEEYVTGVDEVEQKPAHPVFSTRDGRLNVAGLDAEAQVEVYAQDGARLGATKANAHGYASMALPAQKGTVVVKAGSANVKLLLK